MTTEKKKVKGEMIEEAKRKFGKIFPCGRKRKIENCFVEFKTTIVLMFNIEGGNGSTRAIKRRLS